jgi:hypothetical protein
MSLSILDAEEGTDRICPTAPGSDKRPHHEQEMRQIAHRFRVSREGWRRTQTRCAWFASEGCSSSGKCPPSDSVDPFGGAATLHGATRRKPMMRQLREWGFPVGLLLLWAVAAAFTLRSLIGMGATLQETQVLPQSTQIMKRQVAAKVTHTGPAS